MVRLFLIMLFLTAPLLGHAAMDCGLDWARLGGAASPAHDLAQRIKNDWQGLYWRAVHHRYALPQGAVTPLELSSQLTALTDTERHRLIEIIKNTPLAHPADPRTKRFLLLALHEEAAWNEFLEETAKSGTDYLMLNYLSLNLRSMPEARKRKVLAKINELYSTAVLSKNQNEDTISEIAKPKRAYDWLLRNLLLPESFFGNAESPLTNWERYFSALRKSVPNAQPNPYSPKEVLAYAKRVQKELKKKNWDSSVWIGGSLPAGKARAGISDVDLFAVSLPITRDLDTDMKEAIEKSFRSGPLGGLTSSVHESSLENTLRMSRQNPIFIRITKDEMELVIYPATPPTPAAELSRVDPAQNKPLVYPLR